MTTKTKTKSYSNGHHPADPTAERPPPYDDDAERALLGCLMIEQEYAISANGV
jgi:hypothetical protein